MADVVAIRGVNVLASQLPTIREVLESLSIMVEGGMTLEVTEGSRTEAAMEFLAQATAAGNSTTPKDIPAILEEIDAAIADAAPD